MTDSRKAVGQSVDRVDGRDKVLGRAIFAADHSLPGMVHAVLVQSEIPHGLLKASECNAALNAASLAAGVLYILSPENCPHLNELPKELTDDLPLERRPPLSDLTIQHVGQHLALVVADTLENATYAASLVRFNYHPAPAILSAADALAAPKPEGANEGRIRHGSYLPDHFVKLTEEKLQDVRGQAGHTAASFRIAGKYTTPVEHHNPIELSATVASWKDGFLTVYDSTRWIVGSRKTLASYLDMPEDKVRIICPFVGGSFGSKAFQWQHVVLAALAARAVNRPVKLVLTRAQMFTSIGHRPGTAQEIILAADREGRLTSTEHHSLTTTSTVAQFSEPNGLSTRILYQSPHLAVSHRVARINAPTPCFMRGPGEAPGLFALEAAMDELADSLHLDPLELRLRNHADIDQASGKPWSSKHLLECYQEASGRFGWQNRIHAPRAMRRNGLQIGWGMATATYPGRRMPAGVRSRAGQDKIWAEDAFATHKAPVGCKTALSAEGVVTFSSATHEIGTGVRTVMAQIAADASGLPLNAILFISGDSSFPDAPYSGASQTSATVGAAVYHAATELKRRLIEFAVQPDAESPFNQISPEAVQLIDGWFSDKNNPSTREHYLAMIKRANPARLEASLAFVTKSDSGDLDKFAIQSFGAHFCEVEVDEEIGRASVTRWAATFDCGTILNPKLARNQIIGGITFGLGMALLEATLYDQKTALPLNNNLGEYHAATHSDTPEFDISFVEYPDFQLGPMGARGVGEIGACGVAGAIANAIFHATGRRLRHLPITAEQLMEKFPGA
jgi:xanthine dehydrogenase YagR molybdenum-binding subunit